MYPLNAALSIFLVVPSPSGISHYLADTSTGSFLVIKKHDSSLALSPRLPSAVIRFTLIRWTARYCARSSCRFLLSPEFS